MTEHIREVENTNGDLLEVLYFCSRGCWDDSFRPERIGPDTATIGGAFPCATSELQGEQNVYCAECGVKLASEDESEALPIVINLVARPPIS